MSDDSAQARDDAVRAINRSLADAYDSVVYERPVRSLLNPEALFGLAALYGGIAAGADVLDLGCGTGLQLEAAGDRLGGRLVGIDISEEAVARARLRCARFGDRASIMRADALDLNADGLGQFDLIYMVGILYVTPAEVRDRLLALVPRCLKPGGVAVISYCAGTWFAVRSSVTKLLRARDDANAPLTVRVAAARRQIARMQEADRGDGEQHALLADVLSRLAREPDDIMVHEVLNPSFEVLDTPTLAAGLDRHGVRFLTYAMGSQADALSTPEERAIAAGIEDLNRGGYRFAVFCRLPDGAMGQDVRTPLVKWWSSLLRRDAPGGGVEYYHGGTTVHAKGALTRAWLDGVSHTPLGWEELQAIGRRHLAQHDEEALGRILEAEVRRLWAHRFVRPIRLPGQAF